MADNFFGLTDVGKVRDNNEDAFIAQTLSSGWVMACVIDGVGGYEGGEVAADIARTTLLQTVQTANADALQSLKEALLKAARNIYEEKVAGRGSSQMACVLTAALVDAKANQFVYAHVGDTRMYLLRDGSLVKVTKDQSFVGFLEDSNRLSEAEAMAHPKRNEINKALGFDAQIDLQDDYIETGSSPFLPGDMLMLCSDGLTDLVKAKEMSEILLRPTSLQQKAQALIDAANGAGGKDNITVVLVKHDKALRKLKATRPVLIKKEPHKVDGAETAITAETTKPKLIEPSASKPKKNNGALWFFVALSLLLALGGFWLWTKNKDLQAAMPKPIVPAIKSAAEKKMRDSFFVNATSELILSPAVLGDTVRLTELIFIEQDSLHINGNGIVLQADSSFKDPAFIVTSDCKHLVLENIVFYGFKTAIITQTKNWQLKNVRFSDYIFPVLEEAPLRLHTDSGTQQKEDTSRLNRNRTHR